MDNLMEISASSRCENFKRIIWPGLFEGGVAFGLEIYGIACSIAACATFGKYKKVNKQVPYSVSWLVFEKFSFLRMASVLNPKNISKLNEKMDDPYLYGTLSSKTTKLIFEKAKELSEESKAKSKTSKDKKTFFKKHVVSRVLFGLSALVSIITRIVDSILGFVGALFVLFTCAKHEKINEFAYKNIGLLGGIFFDVCVGACGFINPKIVHGAFSKNSK